MTAGTGQDSARLEVDWTACEGRGLCADLLPELLQQDRWGFPQARAGVGSGDPRALVDVPDGLAPHARRAVHLCPRLALHLR